MSNILTSSLSSSIQKQIPTDQPFKPRMGFSKGSIDFFKTKEPFALAERRFFIRESPSDYIFCEQKAKASIDELAEILGVQKYTNRETLTFQKLTKLSENVETDFIFIHNGIIVAEAVCFPSMWNPADKIGKTIDEAHANIPNLNEKLSHSINTFMDKIDPLDLLKIGDEGVFLRTNIGITQTNERNQLPKRMLPKLQDIDNCFIRIEEQAFMRLPKTKTIIFGIRVSHKKLIEFIQEDDKNKQGLIKLLETIDHKMSDYKGISEDFKLKLLEKICK